MHDTQQAQKGLHPAHGAQSPVPSTAGRALSLSLARAAQADSAIQLPGLMFVGKTGLNSGNHFHSLPPYLTKPWKQASGRASFGCFLTGQNDSALGTERSKKKEQNGRKRALLCMEAFSQGRNPDREGLAGPWGPTGLGRCRVEAALPWLSLGLLLYQGPLTTVMGSLPVHTVQSWIYLKVSSLLFKYNCCTDWNLFPHNCTERLALPSGTKITV